jgi:hypothetical protein
MSSFDWVTARHECSLGKAFDKLRLDVEADVQTRLSLRERLPGFGGFHYGFEFSENASAFSVTVHGGNGRRQGVKFRLEDKHIAVLDEGGKELLQATVTLDNERQCKFVVGGLELEEWQFRKKALEHIFLGELAQ